MKQELIRYKLKKMPPRISDVDTLETLAKSMKMDRKNVLDELQKLKIHPFKKKLWALRLTPLKQFTLIRNDGVEVKTNKR